MYIETSLPRKLNDKAWFLSPQYPAAPNGKCLNFWYHMSGSHIGTMNVYIKDGLTIGTKVWNETGDQGNFWLHARAPIKINNKFRVRFVIHAVVSFLCYSVCSCAMCYWFSTYLLFPKDCNWRNQRTELQRWHCHWRLEDWWQPVSARRSLFFFRLTLHYRFLNWFFFFKNTVKVRIL